MKALARKYATNQPSAVGLWVLRTESQTKPRIYGLNRHVIRLRREVALQCHLKSFKGMDFCKGVAKGVGKEAPCRLAKSSVPRRFWAIRHSTHLSPSSSALLYIQHSYTSAFVFCHILTNRPTLTIVTALHCKCVNAK